MMSTLYDQVGGQALLMEGLRRRQAGDIKGAAACFQAVAQREPDNPDALHCLATVALETGSAPLAVKLLQRASALQPDNPQIRQRLGEALVNAGDPAAGVIHLEQAQAADPDNPALLFSLAGAQAAVGRPAAARALFDRLVQTHPDHPLAPAACGAAAGLAEEADDPAAALALYDRALACAPGDRAIHYNRGLIHLALGHFAPGWTDLRRFFSPGSPGSPGSPEGPVEPPPPTHWAGRRLLLDRWQGIGDELFFLRFAAPLAGLGAEIHYRPTPKIGAMIARNPAIAGLVPAMGAPALAMDAVFSVGEAPWLLGSTPADPTPPAFALTPLPERRAEMAKRLRAAGPPPHLGITWRAGRTGKVPLPDDAGAAPLKKAIDPGRLGRLLAGFPGTVFILQRQPEPFEIEAFQGGLGREAVDLSTINEDLEGMLALLAELDDYAAVSNANVHMRAGVGRPTRVLVPRPAEWRWLASGERSPWFPDCPLYRQEANGGWEPALMRLAGDLGM